MSVRINKKVKKQKELCYHCDKDHGGELINCNWCAGKYCSHCISQRNIGYFETAMVCVEC